MLACIIIVATTLFMCCVFNLLMKHHPVILVVSIFLELGVFGGLFPLICSIALSLGFALCCTLLQTLSPAFIRVSVDALYRGGTGQISCAPHTKRLKTRRESLPRPSKHTSNNLRAHIYLYMFPKTSYAPSTFVVCFSVPAYPTSFWSIQKLSV